MASMMVGVKLISAYRLVALLVVGVVPAEPVVVRGGLDLDLVVERAAAGVIDLLEDIPGLVVVVLAVLGVGSELVDDALLDGPVLEGVGGAVVDAAEAVGLLGAVLQWRNV
jgi:hypothetical protein